FAASPASAANPCTFNEPEVQYACAVFANFGGHEFDHGEAAFWAGVGQTEGRFAEVGGLLYSPELMASEVVESVYGAVRGRPPDPSGALFWTAQVGTQSLTYEQLIGTLGATGEGMAHLTNDQFVTLLYGAFV